MSVENILGSGEHVADLHFLLFLLGFLRLFLKGC